MSISERSPDEVARLLAAEFPPGTVKYRPGVVSGNKAMALAYVDARVIQDRLDEVLGVLGWQDAYDCLPDGCVVCRLRIKVGDEWICKEDVGSPSEQPDEGDRRKASFSDALKRAAVKFGIGRYLYRLKSPWLDYDVAKKRFVKDPSQVIDPAPPAQQAAQQNPPQPAPLTAEQVATELSAWRKWLETRPDREAVNESLPIDFAKLLRQVKKQVWEMICDHATKQGWVFDPGQKGFIEKPQEKAKAS